MRGGIARGETKVEIEGGMRERGKREEGIESPSRRRKILERERTMYQQTLVQIRRRRHETFD